MLNYFVFGSIRRALKTIFYLCPGPSADFTDLTVNNNPGAAVWCGWGGGAYKLIRLSPK